ncbi:MFS general substrate transporter [Fistulina hepatica ATCC 64428]|uniref:MFS general substrate transporter n=1 Tax=Fistulina hepatica ATCC 64428 TaxID=1128425 RepID=A0A0D7A7F7_9AGAR|nr:MFS general substrate transporter [Fistulina hepatica ATCC 64428]
MSKNSSQANDIKVGALMKTAQQSDGLDDFSEIDCETGVDKAYELKCALINKCLQEEVGYGRYQVELFVLTGLGWAADNIWLQGIALILSQVQQELNPVRIELGTLAFFIGTVAGSAVWGLLTDLIGRKIAFKTTLFLAGTFGIATGASPSFAAFGCLAACLGFGIGGNLLVDGALYLEHVPQSHQWTLTLLSGWWALGQVLSSGVAWGFIEHYSCTSSIPQGECPKAENMGWRYTCYTLGCITLLIFILRFVVFDLQESSKYLIARGRDEEAIKVLQHIARRNGKSITLTVDQFAAIRASTAPPTVLQVFKQVLSPTAISHVKPLFAGRRLAINTSLTVLVWSVIGLAFPLFNAFEPLYLEEHAAGSSSYRNYTIISTCGVAGAIIASIVIDWSRTAGRFSLGGRKLTMAIATMLTGIFLFLFTTATTEAAVLGYLCSAGVTQTAMYGVLYAYTPEVFPAPHRGTGDALCSSINRFAGVLAPIIKIATSSADGMSGENPNKPIWVSGSLFLVASILIMFLPIETAGKAAL